MKILAGKIRAWELLDEEVVEHVLGRIPLVRWEILLDRKFHICLWLELDLVSLSKMIFYLLDSS